MKHFLTLLACLAIISCAKEPVKPTNEVLHKLHDDPYEVELTLVSGHLHENDKGKAIIFHSDPVYKEDAIFFKQMRTIRMRDEKGGWKIDPTGDTCFVVRAASNAGSPSVYGLIIKYFNKKGEEITSQFATNGQDKIHQHFFIPVDVTPIGVDGKDKPEYKDPSKIMDYTYMDTNPWNEAYHDGAEWIGEQNPIGLKGFFVFKQPRTKMNLNIRLMHASISKKRNGRFAPFYSPLPVQNSADHWDLSINVPVYVAHDIAEEDYDVIDEGDDWQAAQRNATYDQLTDKAKMVVRSIAAACNISNEQALKEWKIRLFPEKKIDMESGHIWF